MFLLKELACISETLRLMFSHGLCETDLFKKTFANTEKGNTSVFVLVLFYEIKFTALVFTWLHLLFVIKQRVVSNNP